MLMEDIFEMARGQAGKVTAGQFPSVSLLKYANIVYKEIENALVRRVNENYFYDILKADTVEGQNEYTFKSTTGTVVGIKKIITANIKYHIGDTEYKKLEYGNTNLSEESIDSQATTTN
jgi:hypothetical protein